MNDELFRAELRRFIAQELPPGGDRLAFGGHGTWVMERGAEPRPISGRPLMFDPFGRRLVVEADFMSDGAPCEGRRI
mgnify:CR=1 FL=1